MSTDYIMKAMNAESEEDPLALETNRSLSIWSVGTLKRCVKVALSNDRDIVEVLR